MCRSVLFRHDLRDRNVCHNFTLSFKSCRIVHSFPYFKINIFHVQHTKGLAKLQIKDKELMDIAAKEAAAGFLELLCHVQAWIRSIMIYHDQTWFFYSCYNCHSSIKSNSNYPQMRRCLIVLEPEIDIPELIEGICSQERALKKVAWVCEGHHGTSQVFDKNIRLLRSSQPLAKLAWSVPFAKGVMVGLLTNRAFFTAQLQTPQLRLAV